MPVNVFSQARLFISHIEMTTLEAEVVRLHIQGHSEATIARPLKTPKRRISRAIRFDNAMQMIPVASKASACFLRKRDLEQKIEGIQGN